MNLERDFKNKFVDWANKVQKETMEPYKNFKNYENYIYANSF